MEEDITQSIKPDTSKKRRNYPFTIQKRKSFTGEVPPGKKYCPECATILEIDLFMSHTGKMRNYCIPCTNKLERLRYQKSDKSYQRERVMKRNYNGFSSEQYNALLKAQDNACAICKRPETYIHHNKIQSLSIDHCHKTNKVRALLCSKCNAALGLMEENPEAIQALLDYAKRWQNT